MQGHIRHTLRTPLDSLKAGDLVEGYKVLETDGCFIGLEEHGYIYAMSHEPNKVGTKLTQTIFRYSRS